MPGCDLTATTTRVQNWGLGNREGKSLCLILKGSRASIAQEVLSQWGFSGLQTTVHTLLFCGVETVPRSPQLLTHSTEEGPVEVTGRVESLLIPSPLPSPSMFPWLRMPVTSACSLLPLHVVPAELLGPS